MSNNTNSTNEEIIIKIIRYIKNQEATIKKRENEFLKLKTEKQNETQQLQQQLEVETKNKLKSQQKLESAKNELNKQQARLNDYTQRIDEYTTIYNNQQSEIQRLNYLLN